MPRDPIIIQFNKPSNEHNPNPGSSPIGCASPCKLLQSWSPTFDPYTGEFNPHKNKFLQASGQYAEIDGDFFKPGKCKDIQFWAEWEPESEYVCLQKKAQSYMQIHDSKGPKNRHYLKNCIFPGGAHNTDPFIFGDSFLYTNCKQKNLSTNTYRTISNPLKIKDSHGKDIKVKLNELDKGDIILFGSCKKKCFHLTLLFVIKEKIEYTPQNWFNILSPITKDIEHLNKYVYGPLFAAGLGDQKFTQYKGKMLLDSNQGDIFSFFPCNDSQPFPAVGFDFPIGNVKGQSGCNFHFKNAQNSPFVIGYGSTLVKAVWDDITERMFKSGYYAGVKVNLP